ncbi:MAG: phosphoenolpyruvate--protein phosphotransferase [Deltaproteobacteria bacterium]|jgi:phosphocarrier protein FPr|nr:phosphoenolpyruvate--protein phosphotransferase [Deltaproteobacteria bacterium]
MISLDPQPSLVLVAPLTGLITPLENVPDYTFANELVGHGVAIDPTDERLVSPCDGQVTRLHSAGHALTVTTPEGLEVLMHIGLETAHLNGEGFKPMVSQGQEVKTGDPLIDFDADYIAHNASSLLTIVVIANVEKVSDLVPAQGLAEAGKTKLFELRLTEAAPEVNKEKGEESLVSKPIVIVNPAGLHARPSAVLANHSKKFDCRITLEKEDGQRADAKSVISLMSLEVRANDRTILKAKGVDAAEALQELVPLLTSGLGEKLHFEPVKAPLPTSKTQPITDPQTFKGVPASPGLAIGRIHQLRFEELVVEEKGRGLAEENRRFSEALKTARLELKDSRIEAIKKAETEAEAILAAQEELLEDPELLSEAFKGIFAGQSAAYAWRAAYTLKAKTLAAVKSELIAGRANDTRDVGRRVLKGLTGFKTQESRLDYPANSILIAKDLTPSDVAALDKSKVLGIATTSGSATSHVAILARAAGFPAVAALEESAQGIPNGTLAVLNGDAGELTLNPSEQQILAVKEGKKKAFERRRAEMAAALIASETTDGHRIKVVGNIGGLGEAYDIPQLGGEGVGLLRSEFLFLRRSKAPEQKEQEEVYAAIAKALGPDRDLVVRTLDVGGDKPLAYLPLPHEANPYLGARGVRLNLFGLDLFKAQVRAILRAAPFTRLSILLPMVTSVDELKEAKDLVLEEKESLKVKEEVKIGVMVEVPAAALLAEIIAKEADFLSIGANDLTQYALAMDRGHPKLAKLADALHPAVLRLIDLTVKGAHANGKWVGVCGGIAGDLLAGPVLIGLGVDELSVAGRRIPTVKAMVRSLNFRGCKSLARETLTMSSAKEVRGFLAQNVGSLGLGRPS